MTDPAPFAYDGLDRVIHIGSFSKTLSASARCGFIAAKPAWIDGLTDLKIATSFGGGRLSAELVLNVLSDGGYRKHLEILRGRLQHFGNGLAHGLVIVDQKDANPAHDMDSALNRTLTRVPRPDALRISSLPPLTSARSRIVSRP